jgi:hypothetical protein
MRDSSRRKLTRRIVGSVVTAQLEAAELRVGYSFDRDREQGDTTPGGDAHLTAEVLVREAWNAVCLIDCVRRGRPSRCLS